MKKTAGTFGPFGPAFAGGDTEARPDRLSLGTRQCEPDPKEKSVSPKIRKPRLPTTQTGYPYQKEAGK